MKLCAEMENKETKKNNKKPPVISFFQKLVFINRIS